MRTIVCGAPERGRGPGRDGRAARRGAAGRHQLGRAKLRGVESDGMILSETEVAARHRQRGHHGAAGLATRPARRRAATCRSATTCSSSRSRPNRPDCLRRLRRRARGARGDRRAARAGPRRRGRRRPRARARAATCSPCHGRGPRAVPAVQRARLHGRAGRALAAVAEGAPDGGRPAPDQQRGRHHQLRDAAARPADARLRPRPGRRPGAARAHARARASGSRRSTARSACSTRDAVLVCDADGPTGHRRDHGRRRAARSRPRRRASRWRPRPGTAPTSSRPPSKLGLRTRGEQRASRSSCIRELALRGAAAGRAPDGRAVRRAHGAGHDRRGGAGAARRAASRCAPARLERLLGERIEPGRVERDPRAARASASSSATATSRSRCPTSATTTCSARPT